MTNTFCPPTALHGSVDLPFVIPSAAEGSAVPRTFLGNVCGSAGLLWFCRLVLEVFFEEEVEALRPVGPTAKRQPSPAGLGLDSPTLSERRRRGTIQPASVLCRKTFPGMVRRTDLDKSGCEQPRVKSWVLLDPTQRLAASRQPQPHHPTPAHDSKRFY
jgi:hypothetical protein